MSKLSWWYVQHRCWIDFDELPSMPARYPCARRFFYLPTLQPRHCRWRLCGAMYGMPSRLVVYRWYYMHPVPCINLLSIGRFLALHFLSCREDVALWSIHLHILSRGYVIVLWRHMRPVPSRRILHLAWFCYMHSMPQRPILITWSVSLFLLLSLTLRAVVVSIIVFLFVLRSLYKLFCHSTHHLHCAAQHIHQTGKSSVYEHLPKPALCSFTSDDDSPYGSSVRTYWSTHTTTHQTTLLSTYPSSIVATISSAK